MKKIILLTLFSLSFGLVIQAQTKPKSATPVKTSHAVPKVDTSLCKINWKLVSVEEWAVVSPPKTKQKEDFFMLTTDGKFTMKQNGAAKAGTRTKTGAYINFVEDPGGAKFMYKVENTDGKKLRVDLHDADGTHTFFEFEGK
jgi:hypothetical protein